MKTVFYGLGLQYDSGSIPAVGVNRSGTVLEVHKNEAGFTLYYHVGRLNKATINWGPSRQYDTGTTPDIALNAGNIAVEVHKNELGSTLYYHVGTVNGDTVTWSASREYDSGITPAVALNDLGIVVEVHKTQSPFSNGLYYHVGQVQGDKVSWGSSHEYDTGSAPRVAVNNSGVVVEVHQSQSANTLWYHVGRVNGTKIDFGGSVRFDDGANPSVALTDDGFVIVTFQRGTELFQRTGQVNGNSISWSGPAAYYDDGVGTSVAAAGTMSVEVHEGELLKSLWFSTSIITDRATWMQNRLPSLGNTRLGSLVLPASHDAAMYLSGIAALGKTQELSIYGQLDYGIRYFDLRPKWTGSKFVLYHGPITGPDLSVVLEDIRRFCSQGRRELAVLKLSHFDNIDNETYKKLIAQIDAAIGTWLVKSTPNGKRLADVTLSEYISQRAAMLVVVDGNYAIDVKQAGFWVYRDWESGTPANGDLRVFDIYSNTTSFDQMKNDQFTKFANYNGRMKNDQNLPCDMFLLSWTLTPVTGVWFTSKDANRRLGQDILQPQNPNRFGQIMNLLYVDYVEFARVTDVGIFQNGERITAAAEAGDTRRAQPEATA